MQCSKKASLLNHLVGEQSRGNAQGGCWIEDGGCDLVLDQVEGSDTSQPSGIGQAS
jgi:hypothetical protein